MCWFTQNSTILILNNTIFQTLGDKSFKTPLLVIAVKAPKFTHSQISPLLKLNERTDCPLFCLILSTDFFV